MNITLGPRIQKINLLSDSTYTKNITSDDVDLLFNISQIPEPFRNPRQEANNTEDDPEFSEKEKDNQNESDENDNVITGLISAFLGGLSKVSFLRIYFL